MSHVQPDIFDSVFQRGRLSIGLMSPIEGYPGADVPKMRAHLELVTLADTLGFPALWLRDIPFRDPKFNDVGQIYDPMVYASWLAAATRQIAIGTAGIVLPLRDPLAVAKQATTLEHLSDGRFILGLSTGDRPTEYPVFGANFDNRAERFRDAIGVIKAVGERDYPVHASEHYGILDGGLDLLPKPLRSSMRNLAVGQCGQDVGWLANNMDGWICHQPDFSRVPQLVGAWRRACDEATYKPYGYGMYFELHENPDAPLQIGKGISTGRHALIELLKRHEAEGVAHVILNMRNSRRPANEVLHELAEYVLPLFA